MHDISKFARNQGWSTVPPHPQSPKLVDCPPPKLVDWGGAAFLVKKSALVDHLWGVGPWGPNSFSQESGNKEDVQKRPPETSIKAEDAPLDLKKIFKF